MTSTPLLELEDVSYQIGDKRILDGVTWRVDQGDHWALLGRNGAGKTTLLRIACGYVWPNAGGCVLRNGEELTDLSELRRSIGWVTSSLTAQVPRNEPAIDTVVSGRYACVGLRRLAHRQSAPEDYEDAHELMTQLSIDALDRRPFGVLSQGEQQKILLARACMAEPMLMILDEPCAGLDPASRERFLTAVEQLAESETTPGMIMVTHHVEEIMPAFTQTLVMGNGRVIDTGVTRELLDGPLLHQLYDGAVSQVIWSRNRCWPVG